MDTIREQYKTVLTDFFSMLEEKRIPARYSEEQGLSILLAELVPGEDVYVDIRLFPAEKELGEFVLLSIGFEFFELEGFSPEGLFDLLAGGAVLNAALSWGGLGVSTDPEKELPISMVYHAGIPLMDSLSGDMVRRELETAFYSMLDELEGFLPELKALGTGELSREKFLEQL